MTWWSSCSESNYVVYACIRYKKHNVHNVIMWVYERYNGRTWLFIIMWKKYPDCQEEIISAVYKIVHNLNLCFSSFILWNVIYRVSQEEWTKFWESVPYVELYRYNPKHLYPKLNGYGDNGQRSLKLLQLLHTYWLPNTY